MAKETFVTIHQELPLQNKGIDVEVWTSNVKGGRLLLRRATVEWYAPHAKKPTWSGTWDEFAQLFRSRAADCDHCGKENDIFHKQAKQKCVSCGKTFKIEW